MSETAKTTSFQFGDDLVSLARQGQFGPAIGRDLQIGQLLEVLALKNKSNAVLTGEPGVGKTAIVEGLAYLISQGQVPKALKGHQIVRLDIGQLTAGTRYRGDFEERVTQLIKRVKTRSNVILFIDEIHVILSAGGSGGGTSAANLLKPEITSGQIKVIGATTNEEYRKYFSKDGAMDRRFTKINVPEPSEEATLQILEGIKGKLEKHHGLTYAQASLEACVQLSGRFMPNAFFPDKAIGILDQAGAHVTIARSNWDRTAGDQKKQAENKVLELQVQKMAALKAGDIPEAARLKLLMDSAHEQLAKLNRQKSRKSVESEDVAAVISKLTGIPVQKMTGDERVRLQRMALEVKSKVIGQDRAVEAVVEAIQRSRIGLQDYQRPIYSGLLVGQTGVGKTELAKQIAAYLFNSKDDMIRLDMSEFAERHSVSKLIGSPPGYLGYEDKTFLDRVEKKPFSVVLLDEIEKAHPDVFPFFLQVMDEGKMTKSNGTPVSFKNCVFLMTSNAATEQIQDLQCRFAGEANAAELVQQAVQAELKSYFAPEFLNRLDGIVPFEALSESVLMSILDLELNQVSERAKNAGYSIQISSNLKALLLEKGYVPEYGARPLRRTITQWVERPISQFIMKSDPPQGATIACDTDGQQTITKIETTKHQQS